MGHLAREQNPFLAVIIRLLADAKQINMRQEIFELERYGVYTREKY